MLDCVVCAAHSERERAADSETRRGPIRLLNASHVDALGLHECDLADLTVLRSKLTSMSLDRSVVADIRWLDSIVAGSLRFDAGTARGSLFRGGQYRVDFSGVRVDGLLADAAEA